jgi:putative flippase GtrA
MSIARPLKVNRLPLLARDLFGYGLASAAALALDWGLLYFLMSRFGMCYLVAAAIGFCAGMAVSYGLSIFVVFRGRRSTPPPTEAMGFVAIGLAGLLVNELLLALFVTAFGLSPLVAKAPTAGLVFLFNFLSRRSLLFAARPAN